MSADNVVEVAVKATIAQLTSGMKEASASVDVATKGMGDSFQVLAEKTIAYQNVNTALKNTLGAMAKGELPIVTSTTRTLADQQQQAAIAARELAAAEAEVKMQMNGVAAAVESTVPQYAAASAAVRTLDGNLSIRAAERFLTTTLGLGSALQVAFPIFGALALMQVLDTMATKVYGLMQEYMGLTTQIRELEKESLALNRAVLTSFTDLSSGQKFLQQTNQQIVALEAEKAAMEGFRDSAATGFAGAIFGAYSLREINEKLFQMEKLRADQLKQLGVVHKDVAHAAEQDAKDAARVQEKALEEQNKAYNVFFAQLRNQMDEKREGERKSNEAMIRLDDELLAQQRKHAEELEKNFRDAQIRKKKELDDSIQDGVAEIEGERRTAKEKIAILQQQLAAAHAQKLIGDKEAVEAEKALVKALYDIDKAALDAKILLLQRDPERNHKEIVKSNAELVTLEQKLQLDLNKATTKGVTERMQKYHQAFSQLEGSFASSIKGMVNGTETLGDAVKNMASGIVDQFIDMLSKMLFTWIEKHVMMLVFGKATNAQEIAANAALAASAAYASVAAIPVVGWMMAPAVGAAAYGEVMAMQGLNAFAQGGIVSGDQVARVHDEEMILPQHLSRGLQDMFAGSSGGTGGGDVHLHYSPSVSAIDAKGMDSVLMKHSKSLVKVVRREVKAGRLK